jgi:hypothetical protein
LVARAPDAILTTGRSDVGLFLQITRTVPIMFAGLVDPAGAGFVASLARPGGNVTGFTQFEYGMSAGTAQADRAPCNASGNHSGFPAAPLGAAVGRERRHSGVS